MYLVRKLEIISIINIISVSSNAIWIMYFPFFLSSIDLNKPEIGLIFSLAVLFGAVGNAIGGKLADIYGKKKILLVGYCIYALAPLLILTNYLYFILLLYPLMLLGGGIASPILSMMVVTSAKKRKGLTYMIVQRVLPSIPPALTAPVGAVLYTSGSYSLSVIIGVIGLIFAAFLITFIPETVNKNNNATVKNRLKLFNILTLSLFLLICAYSLEALSNSAISWYVPLFLKTKGITVFQYGIFVAISTLVIAVGSLAMGFIVDKIQPIKALMFVWLTVAGLIIVFTYSLDYWIVLSTYLIWNALDMIDAVGAPIIIDKWYSTDKTSVLGLFSGIIKIITIPGAAIGGLLAALSPKMPFIFKVLANITAAFLMAIILFKNIRNENMKY